MTVYGYARVSTKDQNLQSQLDVLAAAGCSKILQEKISGKNREDRPALEKALGALKAGDVLIVSRLDRLARSSRDLLNIVHQVSEAGASFKSIKDTWCDTTTAHGRLIMTVLSGLAEFEREMIISRTSEGRERALSEGVQFGRKPKLNAHQRREALARRAAGESIVSIARSYDVSHSMISRL